jgi:hypothetical protein
VIEARKRLYKEGKDSVVYITDRNDRILEMRTHAQHSPASTKAANASKAATRPRVNQLIFTAILATFLALLHSNN